MESILMFVSVVMIVFGILQIILFFKLWGMTNDIGEIKRMIDLKIKQEYQERRLSSKQNDKLDSDVRIEDLVVELKNERQLKVVSITDEDKFECMTPGGISPVGLFSRDEIELFDKYWNRKKSKQ